MPKEILKNFLDEFKVKNEDDLIVAKTTEKQTRALVTGPPKLVELNESQCKKLCEKAGVQYTKGYESRVLEYITTDESVDRYGDIVRNKQMDFKTNYFPNNPVVMYMHNYKLHPIGNSIKIWRDASAKTIPAWGLFADPDTDITWTGELALRMARSGFMRACSIGFLPNEWRRPKDDTEREKLGLGKYGIEYIVSEYLEWSPCGIPANPGALNNFMEKYKENVSFELFDKETIDKMAEIKIVDLETIDMFSEFAKGKVANVSVSIPKIKVEDDEDETKENAEEGEIIEAKESSPVPVVVNINFDKFIDLIDKLNKVNEAICKLTAIIEKSFPESHNADTSDTDDEDYTSNDIELDELDVNLNI